MTQNNITFHCLEKRHFLDTLIYGLNASLLSYIVHQL
jgi:hypothetical protein